MTKRKTEPKEAENNPIVIVTGTPKGGSGKTTTKVELVVAALLDGAKVIVFDYDRNGSLYDWSTRRESDAPLVKHVWGQPLKKLIERAKEKGYDYIFVDTKGDDDPTVYEAMAYADFVIIPIRGRKMDIAEAKKMIKANVTLDKELIFLPCGTNHNIRKDLLDRLKALELFGTISPHRLSWRTIFQDVNDEGLSVLELQNPSSSDQKAIEEVQQLWKWLKQHFTKFHKKS